MKTVLDSLELQLCDIQGRLFELSRKQGLDSQKFVCAFMNSQTAAFFDLPYDRLQWAGEEYILEDLNDEVGGLIHSKEFLDNEVLYWAGYLYRYWHFLTNETSKEIYQQADLNLLNEVYDSFHTMDCKMAVEDLKEIYRQNRKLSSENSRI